MVGKMDVGVSAVSAVRTTLKRGDKVTRTASAETSVKPIKYTTADLPLPNVEKALTKWRAKVVPTVLSFVASLDHPWEPDSTGEETNVIDDAWFYGYEGEGGELRGLQQQVVYKVVRYF